jgi:hypothetical protein
MAMPLIAMVASLTDLAASTYRRRRMVAHTIARIAGATLFLSIVVAAHPARAGSNDLRLNNLCPTVAVAGNTECRWVGRGASGITGVTFDLDGKSKFRSLMSELGVALAPRIPMTANTLGFAGFQVSGELGLTGINAKQSYWDGVRAVSPSNPGLSRPDNLQSTVGLFLRKGFWLPVPTFELGGGFVNLLGSQMISWQGYAKVAVHEGFHDWPVPALAVRAAVGYLTGTDQITATTSTIDILISKGFGLFKTVRLEPFGGVSWVRIKAKSGVIDFTPSCDSHALQANTNPDPTCVTGDALASAAFPEQDAISRYRFLGGAKLKFGILAILAEYAYYPAGRSRDGREPNGAMDHSGGQSAFTLSTGLHY